MVSLLHIFWCNCICRRLSTFLLPHWSHRIKCELQIPAQFRRWSGEPWLANCCSWHWEQCCIYSPRVWYTSTEQFLGVILISVKHLMMLVQKIWRTVNSPIQSSKSIAAILSSYESREVLQRASLGDVMLHIWQWVWSKRVFHSLLSCHPCAFFPNLYTNLLSTRSKIPVL